MAKNEVVQVEVLEPQVSIKVDVSKEDILAVCLYEHERQLDVAKHAVTVKISTAEKELEKVKQDITKAVQQVAMDKFNEDFQTAIKSIKAFGFNVSGKLNASLKEKDDDGVDKSSISVALTMETDGRAYGRDTITTHKETWIPASIKALITKRDKITADLETMRGKKIEIRQAMDNMGKNERAAKAKLAYMNLNQTDNGRKALTQLKDLVDMPGAHLLTEGNNA